MSVTKIRFSIFRRNRTSQKGLLITGLLIAFVIPLGVYIAISKHTGYVSDKFITQSTKSFTVKNGILSRIDETGQEYAVQQHEAKLDPTGRYAAYTNKRAGAWGVEPFIYIYDLNTNQTVNFPTVDDDIPRFVYSWSPNSNYVLLTDSAQAVGELKGRIYSTADGSLKTEFQMYDHNSVWSNDGKFYFLSSTKSCSKENASHCKLDKILVNQLSLLDQNIAEIGSLPTDKLPIIEKAFITDKGTLEIDYSTYDYPRETKKSSNINISNEGN